MSKFAIGEKVDNAADDHEVGTVIAVFPTVDGQLTAVFGTRLTRRGTARSSFSPSKN